MEKANKRPSALFVKSRARVRKLGPSWINKVYKFGILKLAHKSGLPPPTLYNKLRGQVDFFEDEIKKIDKALKSQRARPVKVMGNNKGY